MEMKFCTIDYVGERNPHAKFGWRPKKCCPLGLGVKMTMTPRVLFISTFRALLQLTLKGVAQRSMHQNTYFGGEYIPMGEFVR